MASKTQNMIKKVTLIMGLAGLIRLVTNTVFYQNIGLVEIKHADQVITVGGTDADWGMLKADVKDTNGNCE